MPRITIANHFEWLSVMGVQVHGCIARFYRFTTFGLHQPVFCDRRPCQARREPGVDGTDPQCRAAGKKCMAQLWADVGLNVKPFFSRSGSAVEARQQLALRGQVLANACMGSKLLFAS